MQNGFQHERAPSMDTVYYRKRQIGCLWILLLIWSFFELFAIVAFVTGYAARGGDLSVVILGFCWALATIYVAVSDKGEYLQIEFGPLRSLLCGMGKEKIPYDIIKDYAITQSCAYGLGIPFCNAVKLFTTCSCCCGGGRCFGHQIVRLTIKEQPQAYQARDDTDSCFEACFFSNCCGERCRWQGSGCCCQPCCNPCKANCCMMNTIYVSTNDAEGLMRLLDQKVGQTQGGGQETQELVVQVQDQEPEAEPELEEEEEEQQQVTETNY